MRISPAWGRPLFACFGIALLAATGCSSNGGLTGKVTYTSFALKGGTVTFIPEGGGQSFSTEIKEDGTYTMEGIKTGKYKVCVDTSNLKPQPVFERPGAGKGVKNEPPPGANVPEGYKMSSPYTEVQSENARRYVPIPGLYADVTETTLHVEITGKGQVYNIILS